MILKLISLPTGVGLPIFIGFTAILAFGSYFLMRQFIKNHINDNVIYFSKGLFRITASLLALLISLTFADVRSELVKLRDSIQLEASQIVDIFRDLDMVGTSQAEKIQKKVVIYTKTIIDDEWPKLSNGELSKKVLKLFDEIQIGLLNLKTESKKQETLRSMLLQDIDEISDYRQVRYYHAKADPPDFIYIALFGFIITMSLNAINSPEKVSLVFLFLYSAFFGIVLYYILAFNNPFQGTVRISPEPFQAVLRDFLIIK